MSSLRKKGSRAEAKEEEEGLESDDPNDSVAERQRKRQEWLDAVLQLLRGKSLCETLSALPWQA